LCEEGAEFLVVGAHAVMVFTAPRYTKALDVWTRPTPENAARVHRALALFGAPMGDPRSRTSPSRARSSSSASRPIASTS
jgi:hypothetical protein